MVMSRQRMLPPDIFTDELLIDLPLEVRWTAVGLRMHADDHGRETANPLLLKSSIWPASPEITPDSIVDHLLLLDQVGYIAIYAAGGRNFYAVAEWPVVSHPARSRIPEPPAGAFQSASGGPPESFSAGERGERDEREWAAGAEERPPGSALDLSPSPFCKIHQPNGTTNDCRHCGTARLAHDHWIERRRAEERARMDDERER